MHLFQDRYRDISIPILKMCDPVSLWCLRRVNKWLYVQIPQHCYRRHQNTRKQDRQSRGHRCLIVNGQKWGLELSIGRKWNTDMWTLMQLDNGVRIYIQSYREVIDKSSRDLVIHYLDPNHVETKIGNRVIYKQSHKQYVYVKSWLSAPIGIDMYNLDYVPIGYVWFRYANSTFVIDMPVKRRYLCYRNGELFLSAYKSKKGVTDISLDADILNRLYTGSIPLVGRFLHTPGYVCEKIENSNIWSPEMFVSIILELW